MRIREFFLAALMLAPAALAQSTDLGGGLAGTNGIPVCSVHGTFDVDQSVEINLEGAKPNAQAVLVIGASVINLPYLGGILVPSPDIAVNLTTDALGQCSFMFTWPDIGNAPLYFQYTVIDDQAPQGLAYSNTWAVQGGSVKYYADAAKTILAFTCVYGNASVRMTFPGGSFVTLGRTAGTNVYTAPNGTTLTDNGATVTVTPSGGSSQTYWR